VDGPHAVVDSDGLVYITDPALSRVVVSSPDGQLFTQLGWPGTGPGQFLKPVGIAIGPDGRIYVTDNQTCRVQAFELAQSR